MSGYTQDDWDFYFNENGDVNGPAPAGAGPQLLENVAHHQELARQSKGHVSYLVTWCAEKAQGAGDGGNDNAGAGAAGRPPSPQPGQTTKAEFRKILVDGQHAKHENTKAVMCAVFSERHKEKAADGSVRVHYHAVLATKGNHRFRFTKTRDVLQNKHHMKTHWQPLPYQRALGYCVIPSNKKPDHELDKVSAKQLNTRLGQLDKTAKKPDASSDKQNKKKKGARDMGRGWRRRHRVRRSTRGGVQRSGRASEGGDGHQGIHEAGERRGAGGFRCCSAEDRGWR